MDVMARFRTVAAAGLALAATSAPVALAQASLFTAVPVELSKFVLVSAPIGQGERSQLNIYEQRTTKRPCFAVAAGSPATSMVGWERFLVGVASNSISRPVFTTLSR